MLLNNLLINTQVNNSVPGKILSQVLYVFTYTVLMKISFQGTEALTEKAL